MEAVGDVEIASKTLQFEHKLFCFDLKENPRGCYLKISETTSSSRSTIIVPVGGIGCLIDFFDYALSAESPDNFTEIKLDSKVFYFDIGENRRGRFLKVSEASGSRNRSIIIVPAGSSGEEGWTQFRNTLAEINDEASQFFTAQPQNMQRLESSVRIAGLSDDAGTGIISRRNTQAVSAAESNVDIFVESPTQGGMGNMVLSKVIRADQKKFFFDLGSNNRGHFLRISEVTGTDRSSIILPLSGLRQFHEILSHFVDITKVEKDGTSS